jgi:transposase
MTSQAKQKYTAEFKENAVKRGNESDNVTEVAGELGIKENTLYNRVYHHSRSSKPDKPMRTNEHLYDELKRLKKENARLTEKRDLLKMQRTLPEKHGEVGLDLAVVLDLYSRQVVGRQMKTKLANYALLMAIWKRKPKKTYCGSQYASERHLNNTASSKA